MHASFAGVITKGGVYHGAVWQIKWREDYVCARGGVTHYITVIECMQTKQERGCRVAGAALGFNAIRRSHAADAVRVHLAKVKEGAVMSELHVWDLLFYVQQSHR